MNTNKRRPSSVFMGRDYELLPLLFEFYAPLARVVRDVTANTRRMWKGVQLGDMVDVQWYDIDPTVTPDVVCSWNALPDYANSVDVLVFDPPHLPVAAASPKSLKGFVQRYGLKQSVQSDNIQGIFPAFLQEAQRVLKQDGLIFAKIKDYVHNHHYQWNLSKFITTIESIGYLTPCDLIIKKDPSAGNLQSGRWKHAFHARNAHCYWLVIRKGKCEPKK